MTFRQRGVRVVHAATHFIGRGRMNRMARVSRR
jgi:hypothetical protein